MAMHHHSFLLFAAELCLPFNAQLQLCNRLFNFQQAAAFWHKTQSACKLLEGKDLVYHNVCDVAGSDLEDDDTSLEDIPEGKEDVEAPPPAKRQQRNRGQLEAD